MCVVSVVVDASRQQWGQISQWPTEVAYDMKDIIRRLDAIDKKLGAKDCYDPKKQEFIAELEARIARLERIEGIRPVAKDAGTVGI